MAQLTKIEWADHTFNPVTGCQKVGPGCDNCYAEGWAKRSGLVKWGPKEARRVTSDAYWRQPIKWNNLSSPGNPKRVFCGSLCDVFDNDWPEGVRERLGDLIRATPNLIWMLLTKRIGNAARFLAVMFPEGVPANVWVGATIVNREEMLRDGPKLKALPVAVHFWSCEPLLGDIGHVPPDLLPEWMIVGGESGPKARPMHPDWARSLRDQCQAGGAAHFFKQWGQWLHQSQRVKTPYGIIEADEEFDWSDADERGLIHIWHDQGASIRLRKSHAGRLLDGREWNEVPG